MTRLLTLAPRAAAAHPRLVLIVWTIFTLLPIGGLWRLRRDTDGQAMVPRGDTAIRIDHEVRARFGLRDQLIVYFESGRPGGMFDARLLAAVKEVTERAAEMPEITRDHVTSLGTEPRDRLYPASNWTYGDFLTPLPTTARHFAELAEDLDRPVAQLYRGTLVAADRSGVAIALGIPSAAEADRAEIHRRIESIVGPLRGPGVAIHVVGAPAAEATLAEHILRDIVLLVPLSMMVIGAIIWRGTRRLAPVVIVLAKTGACIVWTFSILGWMGVPVYLTVAIVPVILASMCIADEVHVLTRFQRDLDVAATFDDVALPVVAATLTTCIGFLACLPSRVAPVQALGIASAIGIAWSLLFTLFVTPALLALLPPRLLECGDRSRRFPRARSASCGSRWKAATAVAALQIATLLALLAASRLTIQDSWIDNFPRRSPFRRATDHVNERLFGVHRLAVHLALPAEGDLLRPDVLRAIELFENDIRRRRDAGGVIGPWSQLAVVAEFWRGNTTRLIDKFDFLPGRARRQRVVSDDAAQGVVTILLKNANFRDTAVVMDAVRASHDRHLAPLGSSMRFAGDVAVSQAMIAAVVRSQLLSLPLALAGVFAMVVLLCGSIRLAVAAILPMTVSGIWLLGILGAIGVPLGVASSMFFVIALGLGVDSHSIHLVVRYRQVGDAWRAASEVRRAVVINTAAVAGGFGLLALSAVPANRTLGLLVAAGLILGCVLTLGVVPALLARRSELVNREEDKDDDSKVAFPEWRMS